MKNIRTVLILFLLIAIKVSGQSIDSLKITNKELPQKYSFSKKSSCISIQACSFYDMPGIYEALIGKIKRKDIQNFESKDDTGSIMYFEFVGDFKGESFLEGLLWGGNSPTKEHPETYLANKNILIIWSFNKGNEIKKISEDKIKKQLKIK